jgi:hypothetical protein
VVGLKSEVPFVTPHSHIHSAFAPQLPPRASPSCEISLLVVFRNYSVIKGLMPASLARSGGYRDRTGDIQLAKLALSQLS